MFLIKFFKEDLLMESAQALNGACAEAIRNQLGHEDLETTFTHYVDSAKVVVMAH